MAETPPKALSLVERRQVLLDLLIVKRLDANQVAAATGLSPAFVTAWGDGWRNDYDRLPECGSEEGFYEGKNAWEATHGPVTHAVAAREERGEEPDEYGTTYGPRPRFRGDD